MEKAKLILMDVPWDCHYGRRVCHGIFHYARPHRPWLFANLHSYDGGKWPRHVKAAGLISMRCPDDCVFDARRHGVPAVGVGTWSPEYKSQGLAYVNVDPKQMGEMAVEHFLDRGFQHFGMIDCGITDLDQRPHLVHRGKYFVAALRRRKLHCEVFDPKREYAPSGEPLPAMTDVVERVRQWLAGLVKPVAVFCVDDFVGLWVCGVCWGSGIHVPEEVAVLGADDDEMFCSMSYPHLSSIRVPAEQIGFEAARMLDIMLTKKTPRKHRILLPPMGVITRQSTDVMAIEDLYVTKAIRYIREHAHEGLFVRNVIAEVKLSRRPLERRFQKAIGRSPFAEIRRVQIEMIKTLLSQTDKTLETMAPECGFKTVTRMNMAFKKATGMPPGAYRKQFRTQR